MIRNTMRSDVAVREFLAAHVGTDVVQEVAPYLFTGEKPLLSAGHIKGLINQINDHVKARALVRAEQARLREEREDAERELRAERRWPATMRRIERLELKAEWYRLVGGPATGCVYCGSAKTGVGDHVPPLADHRPRDDRFCLYSCCGSCNQRLGAFAGRCLWERAAKLGFDKPARGDLCGCGHCQPLDGFF